VISINAPLSHPLLDFWNFLRRPLAERLTAGIGQKLTLVVLIVALDILLSLMTTPLDLLVEAGGYAVKSAQTEFDPLIALLGSVVVAPVSEEIYFRLGLAPNLLFLFISLVLSTVLYAPKLFGGIFSNESLYIGANVLFYLALSAGICLFFWVRERRGQRYTDFFDRYAGWYYYLGALLFALAHLGNYAQQPPVWAMLILVLPQLIGGLTFGYLRIRLGFWYGVLAHMLTNLLFTLGDMMNFWFGESGGVVWLIVLIIAPLAVLAMPLLTNRRAKELRQ